MTSPERSSGGRSYDEVIAGEYVLGVLSSGDRQKVEARMVLDRGFAAIVQRWQENLVSFDEDYHPETAPDWIFRRIEQRLHGTSDIREPLGFWQSLALWRGIAAFSLLVVAGISFSQFDLTGSSQAPELSASLVSTIDANGSPVSFSSSYDPATGRFRMTPVAAGPEKAKSLELWLIQGKNPAVSLGVLPQSGEGELLVPAKWRDQIRDGDVFAISLETYGGSPTGTAQGPVLAAGPAKPKK